MEEEGFGFGPSSFSYDSSTLDSSSAASTGGTAWFSGLRSKLSAFSMGDWLVQLGIARPRIAPPTPTSVTNSRRLQARAMSAGPLQTEDSAPDQDIDSPTTQCNLPSFWLNLETGGRRYDDTLELQHFGPLQGLVPVGNRQRPGQGHRFEDADNPTWCDKCGDFIWGFYKVAVRCDLCNYTCHATCQKLVTLDCRSVSDSIKSSSTVATFISATSDILPAAYAAVEHVDVTPDEHTSVLPPDGSEIVIHKQVDPFEDPLDIFTGESLRQRIAVFNDNAQGMSMTIHDEDDSRFSGYISIHMNFSRPINVVAGEKPPSFYDCIQSGDTLADHRTIASFFLPRNTVKVLHVDSRTTTRQLIVVLLRKFRVADNPRKFALYSRRYEHHSGETLCVNLQRIPDDAFPLKLALLWGADSEQKLVLQENDTGDIIWEAFEEPELNNFLRILQLEEQHYLWQTQQKYTNYRYQLELEMKGRRASGFHRPLNPPDPFRSPRHTPPMSADASLVS